MSYPARVHPLSRSAAPVAADVPPEKLIAGSGVSRVWNGFSDASGRFHAGFWQSEAGRRRVAYDEDELCVLLVGRVRLTDEQGMSAEFAPGDAFVIAAGFRGTWESIGKVTKIYAVLDPEAAAAAPD